MGGVTQPVSWRKAGTYWLSVGQPHRWTYQRHCVNVRTGGIVGMLGPGPWPTSGYLPQGRPTPKLAGTIPKSWTGSSLLFNPDGALKYSHVGHILVFEVARLDFLRYTHVVLKVAGVVHSSIVSCCLPSSLFLSGFFLPCFGALPDG